MRARPLVIYHANCFDGFTAAWVFHKFYEAKKTLVDPEPEYYPAHYGEAPPDCSGREVYILDFSYKRQVMMDIILASNRTTIYDHHKSAEADLKDLISAIREERNINRTSDKILFDMNRSGAGITYDELAADAGRRAGSHLPKGIGRKLWIVDYVEDRDLWRHALPHSREFTSWMATLPMTFDEWDKLNSQKIDDVLQLGGAVLSYIDVYGKKAIQNARFENIAGYRVPVVNIPYMNCSEHLDALAENTKETVTGEVPFVASYFRNLKGEWVFSLRSKDKEFDVSEVAKQFGGGGHKNAAGFKVDVLPWDLNVSGTVVDPKTLKIVSE